jgi:hypothetical protein
VVVSLPQRAHIGRRHGTNPMTAVICRESDEDVHDDDTKQISKNASRLSVSENDRLLQVIGKL